ncbi:MAG TPA: iron hydrogenase [Candidatus Pacearchaeota archaeon]|nr:iron hydrogenase [Candidatus Pacearchaeota archaeon]HPR79970.1 iron hydrogenase [Candidatus Pacearchaeota archaeon]
MEQTLSLDKKIVLSLVQFLVLLLVVCFAPLINNQIITGTIVNASLLIAVVLLGMRGSTLLCFLPSVISLLFGLLPMVMAPMVPFIIIGNVSLVYIFNLLRKSNFFLGLIPAALVKFSFLFLVSNFLISFFVKQAVADKIAVMMSYPQLVTALMGGIVAYFIIGKNYKNNN